MNDRRQPNAAAPADKGEAHMSMDRRQFVTRGAGLTAGLWVAPQIQNVALAQTTVGSPAAPCCRADATGLIVRSGLLSLDEEIDNLTMADVGATILGAQARVRADVVSSSSSSPPDGPCEAMASVTNLSIVVLSTTDLVLRASVLSSDARATCSPDCGTSGSSTVVFETLRIDGVDEIGSVNAGCNMTNIGGIVFANEQTCDSGVLTVNALRVTIPNVIEVIVAQSQAGADGCPCTPCA